MEYCREIKYSYYRDTNKATHEHECDSLADFMEYVLNDLEVDCPTCEIDKNLFRCNCEDRRIQESIDDDVGRQKDGPPR